MFKRVSDRDLHNVHKYITLFNLTLMLYFQKLNLF